jgi:DNA repair exonuclease SbcCD ATPase subunit
MKINKLELKNFKLFRTADIIFSKINIITGVNGAGKSTILQAILYALYGNGGNTNLTDLISFNTKEATVKLDTDAFLIIRKIPTNLAIFSDDKEIQFNTLTLKQQWLDKQINDFNFFKKYRLLNKQSINLLDLGIVSLRKELMSFIDDKITVMRQQLLSKKLECETYNVDKKLYHFYVSPKRFGILQNSLEKFEHEANTIQLQFDEQQEIVNNIKGEIQAKEKIIYYKKNEIQKSIEGTCPILKTHCDKIYKALKHPDIEHNLVITKELDIITKEISDLHEKLNTEIDALSYYKSVLQELSEQVYKVNDCIMKLKEANKFAAYKYTKADVTLYADAVKVLDSFSGWYIQNWLDNLTLIVNNLLEPMKMSVTFTADKQFLMIKNEEQEMKYESLSEGQQVFLNIVFKIAILMQNGINDGILMLDDSINSLMMENVHKLVDILKQTPYQIFMIKQDIDEEIEDVKYIKVTRNGGESNVS